MSTLLEARTGSGKVTITDTMVILDKPGGMTSESIPRASIARVESATKMVSVFGLGGLKTVTLYTTDGRRVTLDLVSPKVAAAILELLR